MNYYAIYLQSGDVTEKVKTISLNCHSGVNQIPKLTLRLQDGDTNKGTFDLTDEGLFTLGETIEITAGFDDKSLIFSGIISEQTLGIDGHTFLDIIAYGDVIKLTEGPLTQLFADKKPTKDSAIIQALFEGRDVEMTKVDIAKVETDIEHPHYFVYQQTPWRAMMARVLANGWLFVPAQESNKIVDTTKYTEGKPHAISVKGSGLESFKLHQDIRSQFDSVKASSWNTKTQKMGEKEKKSSAITIGELKSSAENLALNLLLYQHGVPLPDTELEAQASAQVVYRKLDRFRGRLGFYAGKDTVSKDIKLLDKLDLSEFGKHYSGQYLVTAIEHVISPQGWRIYITVGLHLNHSLFSDWLTPPPVPNLIGKVAAKDKQKDATYEQHISVLLPSIDEKAPVWARLVSPFASKKSGIFFPPNPDDEVIVGFVGGDCRFPVILGATHNPINEAPFLFNDENVKPGIYFGDKKMSLGFDLKEPTLSIAGGEKAAIVVKDETGPELKCDESSFTLGNDIAIKSKGKMMLNAGGEMNIKTSDKVNIKANLVEIQ
ncbi:phage baseplate assembly protein V [uncultured Shewanella sp.]|uniref:phage baseplate assembly protein V n=1 Tax=uncultured Shewanella sp. TaxID=173975 RepID=UPI0026256EA4|nr:phage baseplate assembly protein V [uncultured Shewanella sp.]